MAMITPENDKQKKTFGQNLCATFPVVQIFQIFFKLIKQLRNTSNTAIQQIIVQQQTLYNLFDNVWAPLRYNLISQSKSFSIVR